MYSLAAQENYTTRQLYLEASKPKWVNSNDIQYGVNSLRPPFIITYVMTGTGVYEIK